MSTSPSWFDQEKFSRLVKKVAPKSVTEPLPSVPSNAQPLQPGQEAAPGGENPSPASTARISLVSKPPSLISEHRSLPALPRRTSPLPSLKPVFAYPTPAAKSAPSPDEAVTEGEEKEEPFASEVGSSEEEESALAETWHKMGLLNEELARAIHERDQAINEGMALREQLRKLDEETGRAPAADEATPDLAKVMKERDDALAEAQTLKNQLARKQEAAKESRSPSQSQELVLLTEERDQARKQYFSIRKEYEDLKYKQNVMPDPPAPNQELEKELAELKLALAGKESEISALKATENAAKKTGPLGDGDVTKLNEEIKSLREQLARAKDEASIAQRGLALSQKALHETRDTLREATEGTSLSRHNFDNLKNECATLSQQNAVLQTKNDQFMKDLALAKKQSGRL